MLEVLRKSKKGSVIRAELMGELEQEVAKRSRSQIIKLSLFFFLLQLKVRKKNLHQKIA